MNEIAQAFSGDLDFDPDSLILRFKQPDFLLYARNVKRLSRQDDGAVLVGLEGGEILFDPVLGRILYKRNGAPEMAGLPLEPIVVGVTEEGLPVIEEKPVERRGSERLKDKDARVTLVGKLGQDPRYRDTRVGKYANFTFAVPSAEDSRRADWHNISVSPKIIAQLDGFVKGDAAVIVGFKGKDVMQVKGGKEIREYDVVRAAVIKRPKAE